MIVANGELSLTKKEDKMSQFIKQIELLEPYDAKVSRTVLRGERGSNASDLPDIIDKQNLISELRAYKLVDQYLFHTDKALKALKFIEAKEVTL